MYFHFSKSTYQYIQGRIHMRKLNENNVLVTLYKAKINNNADNTIHYVDNVWISKNAEVYDSKKKNGSTFVLIMNINHINMQCIA